MVVHADLSFLIGSDQACRYRSRRPSGPNGGAEIQGVGPISREVARRLACDAGIVFSVEGHDGCILDQKRARRQSHRGPAPGDRPTGQRVSLPGVHLHRLHPGASREAVDRRGRDQSGQSGHLVRSPSSSGARVGLDGDGNCDETLTFTGPHGHSMMSSPSPTWPPAARKGSGGHEACYPELRFGVERSPVDERLGAAQLCVVSAARHPTGGHHRHRQSPPAVGAETWRVIGAPAPGASRGDLPQPVQ